MPTFLAKGLSGAGAINVASDELGRGGEGSVFNVLSHSVPGLPSASDLVLKKYHEPTIGNRRQKIIAMVQNAPESVSVAWPLAVVFDQNKMFVGYLMTKLESSRYRMWAMLAHAQDRKNNAESFDVRYALTASKNLAIAIYSVHQAGHKVGDVNESNIFIADDARVLLVDTDSAQIETPDGGAFPCMVGKPEYTAPELSHGALKDQERTEETDVFAYAVAIYQILTGGAHPADGIFKGEDDPPSQVERIRNGWYPGLIKGGNGGLAKVPRVASDAIPSQISKVIEKSLSVNPSLRPNFTQIIQVLDQVLASLQQCSKVREHWFDKRDQQCGWCAHVNQGRPDPWVVAEVPKKQGLPLPQQSTLPAVNFGSTSIPTQAQRAAPAVAGGQAAQAHQQASGQQVQIPQNYVQQAPAPKTVEPTQKELQKHFKTKKTVLSYTDGTYAVRPPLGVMFKSSPKRAIACFKDETPSAAQFWWDESRAVAEKSSLILGVIIGIAFATVWYFTVPMLQDYIPILNSEKIIYQVAGIIAAAGALLSNTYHSLSGWNDRRKSVKKYGNKVKLEPVPKSVLRNIWLSIIYGPLLLVFILGGVVFLVIELLGAILNSSQRSR